VFVALDMKGEYTSNVADRYESAAEMTESKRSRKANKSSSGVAGLGLPGACQPSAHRYCGFHRLEVQEVDEGRASQFSILAEC